MKNRILIVLLFVNLFYVLTSEGQDRKLLLGPVEWSDTTIEIIEPGSQIAETKNIPIAYLKSLDIQLMSRSRSEITDFIEKINAKIQSLTKWKTYRDTVRGIEFRYPQKYSVDTVADENEPGYVIYLLPRGLRLDYRKRNFFGELNSLGLETTRENDFFKGTMETPMYLKAKNYRAVHWYNNRLEFDGSGNSSAQQDDMFLIMIEDSSGFSIIMRCEANLVPLLIASTVKFTH